MLGGVRKERSRRAVTLAGRLTPAASLDVGRIAFQAPGCLNVNIWLSDILLPDSGPPHGNGGGSSERRKSEGEGERRGGESRHIQREKLINELL